MKKQTEDKVYKCIPITHEHVTGKLLYYVRVELEDKSILINIGERTYKNILALGAEISESTIKKVPLKLITTIKKGGR